MNNVYPVKKNHVYPLEIESLAFGGKGVARLDDYVIFVKRALPGDIVKARIIKRKKSYGEAVIESIEIVSPERINAPCSYFDYCGGCTWQNLLYNNQLKYKTQIVIDAVKHISGLKQTHILPIIPAKSSFKYRNKMEFSFADKKWLRPEELNNPDFTKVFALGLHVPGTFDKIIHIENCMLQSDTANAILKYISEYAQKENLIPYGLRSHEGLLRFLVLRESNFTKEIMVNIVSAYKEEKLFDLAAELRNNFSEISSIVNNINSRKAQIAVGEEEICLSGKNFIEDKIGSFVFQISANSFFQTNTIQAETLYKKAIDFCELKGGETVWDLYSGTGTLSLFLAQKAQKVVGFEVVPSAIENARANALKYELKNINFIEGDVVKNIISNDEKPDVILTDPPRSGMHAKVVEAMVAISPEKIVYVSCNPTTMARDLKLFSEHYNIDEIQPIDMFPQTYHIECVARLTRKAN